MTLKSSETHTEFSFFTLKPTNQQTNKPTNKQTNKQTNTDFILEILTKETTLIITKKYFPFLIKNIIKLIFFYSHRNLFQCHPFLLLIPRIFSLTLNKFSVWIQCILDTRFCIVHLYSNRFDHFNWNQCIFRKYSSQETEISI